jgi:hypothetical protein
MVNKMSKSGKTIRTPLIKGIGRFERSRMKTKPPKKTSKKMQHKTNRYDARRKCKRCNRVMVRGTGHHIHNKVQIGKFTTSQRKRKK